MQISGLLLTCVDREIFEMISLPRIRESGVFTEGEWNGSHLSLALEAGSAEESLKWHQWLCELPGVVQVEVAFVSYDEEAVIHG